MATGWDGGICLFCRGVPGFLDPAVLCRTIGKGVIAYHCCRGTRWAAVDAGGLFLTKSHEAGEAEEKRSLFYLESCTRAYEEARNLLADGNNDRANWIAAARALKHAQQLSARVRADAHRRVLELHQLKYRGFFAGILRAGSAAFFYGAPDPSTPIDEAAAASSAPERRGELIVTSTNHELSEESLKAIWEAAQWPHDYDDPLNGGGFSKKDEAPLMLFAPALHEYLEHRRRYHSASGKLWPRGKDASH